MRWIEIDTDGIAFHEPGPDAPFSTGDQTPPTDVLFDDSRGVGVVCSHVYANGTAFTVEGPTITEETRAAFLKRYPGPKRRQVFVNVTDRPESRLDPTGATRLRYDEAADTFTVETVSVSTTVSKTAFLAAIGPDLLTAWFASTDPVLVFGREMFKADTSVNLNSVVITQVLAQCVALGLVKPEAAAAVKAAITALPPA